jgi:N-methylhydantoinase A
LHAIECGKDITARSMIAFGGAAPLHAARLAEKLDIDTVVVPTGAGVGSAIGFLRAPISYEVVRSRYMRIGGFDADEINALLDEMSAEARAIVASGAGPDGITEVRLAFMRYVGQGHEIVVSLPLRRLDAADAGTLRDAFEAEYKRLYGRTIPGQEPEVLSWTLTATAPKPAVVTTAVRQVGGTVPPHGIRRVFDPAIEDFVDFRIHMRDDLPIGATVTGPALVVEAQTTTVVSSRFDATVDSHGYLVLTRKAA